MTFAHRLLQRTDARAVLGAAVRCPGGFRVRFLEIDQQLHDPDPGASAAAMNRAIEELVRTDPAQYQWEYKRFKRQPPGSPDLYARAPKRT
jgi:KDO2-lipid IV(A) lauroyltransferase